MLRQKHYTATAKNRRLQRNRSMPVYCLVPYRVYKTEKQWQGPCYERWGWKMSDCRVSDLYQSRLECIQRGKVQREARYECWGWKLSNCHVTNPYLSRMECTERSSTERASLWKVRMTEVWGRSARYRPGALHHSSLTYTGAKLCFRSLLRYKIGQPGSDLEPCTTRPWHIQVQSYASEVYWGTR
jgi:hypothetical protein